MASQHARTGPESLYPYGRALADRLGGLLGLVSVGLLFTGWAIGDPNTPASDLNPSQSSEVIAAKLVDHRDEIVFGMGLHIAGVCLFIAFVAWVAARMGTRESGRWLGYTALGGGFAAAAVMLGQAAIMIGAAQITWYGEDASIARTFAALTWDSVNTLGPALGLFAAAVSLHELGQGRVRAALGAFGLVAAAATLIPWSVWIGAMAVLVWIVALSILLLVSPAARTTSAQQTMVPAPHGA